MRADSRSLRWLARIWAVALIAVWGAFFVEHLAWFSDRGAWPPASVIALQLCHLALLAGLAIGWKWELPGAFITLGSAAIFFSMTAGSRAPAFIAITAVPAVVWIMLNLRRRSD
jgi:hypothetical protein